MKSEKRNKKAKIKYQFILFEIFFEHFFVQKLYFLQMYQNNLMHFYGVNCPDIAGMYHFKTLRYVNQKKNYEIGQNRTWYIFCV